MQSFDSCKMISSEKVFETLGINSFNNLGQLILQRWLQEIEERFRIVIFIGDSEMTIWNLWIIKQLVRLAILMKLTKYCKGNLQQEEN